MKYKLTQKQKRESERLAKVVYDESDKHEMVHGCRESVFEITYLRLIDNYKTLIIDTSETVSWAGYIYMHNGDIIMPSMDMIVNVN